MVQHFVCHKARTESRLVDGSVRGSYSYVDPTNKLVRVVYVADADGFRVLEGNNLPTVPAQPAALETPRPVDYTPEVRSNILYISNQILQKNFSTRS